jgi:hypothetical protein
MFYRLWSYQNPWQPRHRRGTVLIYSLVLMAIIMGVISLAVDYGRAQMIKTQLQCCADSTARGMLQAYVNDGAAYADVYGPYLATNTYNPVDANSGVQPTASITWGWYNSSTRSFFPGSGTPLAVQVTMSRTRQTGNAVPLTFPVFNGTTALRTTCDVWATAVAVLSTNTSVNATISGQSDPWLAGMPNGTQASDLDTAPAQSPPLIMNVTPGTVLTFTNVAGTVTNDPTIPKVSADGDASELHSHNDDDPMDEPAVQNNIGNITAPINSLLGLFLSSNAPNTQPAPTSTLDYSTQAERDVASQSSLQLQQPFFIGDGETSSAVTQTFVVPPGATRLYLGTMDGHQWSNNQGSFTATVTQQQQVYLVK